MSLRSPTHSPLCHDAGRGIAVGRRLSEIPEADEAQFQPSTPALTVPPPKEVLRLPKKPGSYRFAALGDMGRGDKWQHDVSKQMQAFREGVPVRLRHHARRQHLRRRDAPTTTTASSSCRTNRCSTRESASTRSSATTTSRISRTTRHSTWAASRYYTFKPKPPLLARLGDTDVQFFMIDTENVDRTQREWLDREMGKSGARWKIAVFHRPIYTSGRYSLWAPGRAAASSRRW